MQTLTFKRRYIQQGENKAQDIRYHKNLNGSIQIVSYHWRGFRDLDLDIEVRDDSDPMTDYFCRPSITLFEGDKYFDEALAQYNAGVESTEKRKLNKKLKQAQVLEEVPAEERKYINGKWFLITKAEPHHRRENWTAYTLKRLFGRSKKTYYYAESNDGKEKIKLIAI